MTTLSQVVLALSFIWFVACNQNDDSSCVCPSNLEDNHCTDKSFPVLGGVDFVNYFTKFKLPDGSYNESQIGINGTKEYSYLFNGYLFNFESKDNLDLFKACPTCYAPQYGGFCTWGVTGEFCPKYAWSASCLGPPGAWNSWTMYNDKLYFFLSEDPKSKFLEDPLANVVTGDARWNSWFGDNSLSVFDTKCYKVVNFPKNQSVTLNLKSYSTK